MSVSICARVAAAVALWFVVVACSDAPSFVVEEAADAAVDAATVDAGVDSAAPRDSSTPVDAAVDAAPVDSAPVDAGPLRPTTTCIAQASTVANVRCSPAAPGALGGGSIAVGDYVMNSFYGPTCKGYASGAATIYQDGPNLFMRWLRIEDRLSSGDAGVQRSGTVWLRPSAPNRIERVEVCDPGNVGKSEVGTFGVAGNGDLQVDFGTYSEGWQRMP